MLKGKQKNLDANKDGKISGDDFAMLRAKKEPKEMMKMGGMSKKKKSVKKRGMGLQDEQLPPGKMVKANIGMMIEDEAGMEAAGSMSPDDRLTQVDVDYAESAARRKPLPALQEYKRKPMTPKERRAQDIAKRAQKKMGGGMVDPTMANYQKGGSVMARGSKLAKVRPTKLY